MSLRVTGNFQVLKASIPNANAVTKEQKMQLREFFRVFTARSKAELKKIDCKKCKKILDDAGVK